MESLYDNLQRCKKDQIIHIDQLRSGGPARMWERATSRGGCTRESPGPIDYSIDAARKREREQTAQPGRDFHKGMDC